MSTLVRNLINALGKNVMSRTQSRYVPIVRCLSSSVSVITDSSSGFATLELNRKPVNSFTLDFIQEIINSWKSIEKENSRGIILSSALDNVFCAGIDMSEFYQADAKRLNEFWFAFLELISTVYGSPLATIAAINGHAWAGGCLMSLACDKRIMVDGKGKIGSNVVKLGIVAPAWLYSIMTSTIGQRQTELAIQLGHMFPAQEAFERGLVDTLVTHDNLMSVARTDMENMLQIPDNARRLTKSGIRSQLLEEMTLKAKKEAALLTEMVLSDSAQSIIENHVKSLKKKS